jgi:hypothetical protein
MDLYLMVLNPHLNISLFTHTFLGIPLMPSDLAKATQWHGWNWRFLISCPWASKMLRRKTRMWTTEGTKEHSRDVRWCQTVKCSGCDWILVCIYVKLSLKALWGEIHHLELLEGLSSASRLCERGTTSTDMNKTITFPCCLSCSQMSSRWRGGRERGGQESSASAETWGTAHMVISTHDLQSLQMRCHRSSLFIHPLT